MKPSFWVVIVIVSGIVGFLMGYSVSAHTGARNLRDAPAPVAAKPAPSTPVEPVAAKPASGGYGAPAPAPAAKPASGGYGAPAPAPAAKPASGGYGAPAPAAAKPTSGGYGAPGR